MQFNIRILVAAVVAAAVLIISSCASETAPAAQSSQVSSFTLSSPAITGAMETGFDSGIKAAGRIDPMYAAAPGAPGNPRSFPLSWSNVPKGTKALALILDDPDARLVLASFGRTEKSFLHWVATDIDPSSGGLADNASVSASFVQGKNGAGAIGYTGPQPPADIPKDAGKKLIHVYRLKVFALSAPTGLKNGFSQADLEAAIMKTTIGKAELDFSYSND